MPFGTSLVESNGQTILAAIPYRHGRVVVSSFGQWLFPDPAKVYGARWQRDAVVNSAESRTIQSTPLQPFTGAHAKLVQQTIDWLTEARPDEEVVRQQRAEYTSVWLAALKYESQAIPRSRMTEVLDRLVDNTSAEWKEEALWLAGEAHLRMQFFDQRSMLRWPSYGYRNGEPMPLPESNYYERLVTQFPDSPLKAFAQWRVAECGYRPITYYGTKQLAVLDEAHRQSLIKQYEKVLAPTGTLPWAVVQSRLGRIRYWMGDFDVAVTHFRAISENMPPGVERISALLDLSLSLSRLGDNEKANVALDVVKSMPNVELVSSSHGHYGTLIEDEVDSQEVAGDFAKSLSS